MSFEVKHKGDKYYVVDENGKIRGSYANEEDADDRKDDLDFRVEVRERLSRMPVTQMTAEEKAAAYDKLMADHEAKKVAPPDSQIPPKKDPPEEPPKVKRSAYWGDVE